jgi:photosystem II stability/assembly factor-like uncharacterized protein
MARHAHPALFLALILAALPVPAPSAAPAAAVQRLVAADGSTIVDVIPKSGPGLDASSETGGAARAPAPAGAAMTGFSWVLQAQNDGVFTDLSMADATHGFAAAELGRVYRTTDGATWQLVMNIGFPRYWYGVHAFTPDSVFITGFQNQTGEGIARWSTNGGATWTSDIVIDPAHWLTINQFADRQHGVATAIGSGLTYVTTNGGSTAGDWTQVLADPTQGWFAGNFTFLPENLYVYLTGISLCQSTNGGLSYSRRSSIDPVFDGGVCFPDVTHGWTGGGQISAPVQGWVHRTTDGGLTWSGRILNPAYPIRSLLFLDESLGFVVGGNYFGGVGGIWSTTDAGASWNLDADTGCEMKGIDWARVSPDSVSVWSAGSRSGLGRIYRSTVYFPRGTSGAGTPVPAPAVASLHVAPNPARAGEAVRIAAPIAGAGSPLDIVDVSGRVVRRLTLVAGGAEGAAEVLWDGRHARGLPVSPGVYYALLRGRAASPALPLVILR